MGKNIAFSQRENYEPDKLTEFLWWLSTAEKEILIDSVVDRNRYRIIGMTVLGTWLFATFSWIYFFSTIVDSPVAYIFFGAFMGFIILTIDRALIKGITKHNKRKLVPLLFRGLLALTIGTFMAQPAVLYMFDKEVRMQTSLDNETRKMKKRSDLDSLYLNRKNELLANQQTIRNDLAARSAAVAAARENFLAETDGSGGTGKVGIKDIAIAKRNEYQKLDNEYQAVLLSNNAKLSQVDSNLNSIESAIKKEEADFEKYLNNGFLTRIEALTNLIDNNNALKYRYYLIISILILIELMPVIAKTLLPSGSYDEKVALREALEIKIANNNIEKEYDLKELYNQQAFENDKDAITTFFTLSKTDRNEKIADLSKKWKNQHNQSFDGFWEQLKKDILTKQEN